MRIPRIVVVSLLIVGLSAPARAGDLRTSIEQAAQETARRPDNQPIPKTYLWLGSSLFVGGMAVGLFAFMHDKNGQFPGTDEYNATDRKLGAAGLFTAFGGGMLLFIGKRQANRSPVVIFDPGRISLSKQVSW
jgi:hypothetical protein